MEGSKNMDELKNLQEIWSMLFRSNYVLAESLILAQQQTLFPASEHLCNFMEASIGQGRRGPMPFGLG